MNQTSTVERATVIVSLAFGILTGGIVSAGAAAQGSGTSRIDITGLAGDSEAKRPITLEDMISVREVHEPRRSPDGRHIVFLVRQAFRACDCERTALYAVNATGLSAPTKLLEESHLSNLQWLPDSRTLSYLSVKSGATQLWEIGIETHETHQVFTHVANHDKTFAHLAFRASDAPVEAVLDYRWSPDGKTVAFTAEPPIDPAISQVALQRGYRFDDESMTAGDVQVGDPTAALRTQQLWIYRSDDRSERLLWTTPSGSLQSIGILPWSNDGRRIAFGHPNAVFDTTLTVLNVTNGEETTLADPQGQLFGAGSATWLPDGESLLVAARPGATTSSQSILEIIGSADRNTKRRELSREVTTGVYPWIAWDPHARRILFDSVGIGRHREQAGLYSMSEGGDDVRRVTPSTSMVSECDRPQREEVVCVWQAPASPPRPAIVNLRSGVASPLADPNPEMAGIRLAPVQELTWTNAYGDETNGFLILPSGTSAPVPLVIVGYGFDGEFVTRANEVLTTYPAQALARDGIAVLLFNYPRWTGWEGNDFARASRALGYSPLASLQSIVSKLSAEQRIDPTRVGMMGHSLAGFWVEFAISHSKLFSVAELHNGGTSSEPGTYWSFGAKWARDSQEHVMGGPPYGPTLRNYQQFSATLNAEHIHTPVLMEYDTLEVSAALELYAALRHYAVPVEFFVYPNDGHVTGKPEHRFQSLERNLDWFEFWLQGREDPDPAQGEQYRRWERLCDLQRSKNLGLPAFCVGTKH